MYNLQTHEEADFVLFAVSLVEFAIFALSSGQWQLIEASPFNLISGAGRSVRQNLDGIWKESNW